MSDDVMNGYQIYHGFLAGVMSINKERQHLNRINVFPVADGDTGNNMVRTVKMIANRLESSRSATAVLSRIASLSLDSARGNSGMIFSQYLNGLAIHTEGKDSLSMDDFALAAKESVDMAYRAMDKPVEGTILTVLKAWSESLYQHSVQNHPPGEIFRRAFDKAAQVLEKTRDQLQVLKENNVIDAGALGFVSFLKGVETLRFQGPVPLSFRRQLLAGKEPVSINENMSRHKNSDVPPFRYCTEFLIGNRLDDAENLRKELSPLGDSLIINEGKEKTRIHIHTSVPYEAADILRRYGAIEEEKADDMVRQQQVVNARKSSVAVLTDSIADIPQEILDEEQIHVINLKLSWDDAEYLDRVTITPEQFYREQQIRSSFPGSSVPEPGRIESIFQYLTDYYDSVIVLPVARSLSGTWNQMTQSALPYNKTKKRIAVIDTCLNSVAQGLLVREIARQANKGKTLEELVTAAEDLKKKIRIYVSVSTFKYMVKGGRVSPLKGFVASLLHLKPIVSLDATGKGKAFDKAFSRAGLVKKIISIMKKTSETKGIQSYAIVHAAAEKKADEFARSLNDATGTAPDYITSISPIVGMHSGRGALAIGVIEK
ncbi:DegV family protein [Spirochaeta isovalerica]|uniref:DhaL domain-containing protein n=1 Tax=Spirochaeta isovalerica TaxID=150 RepID=A0A841RGH4_9SPIO|nr:DegV family protein [Spirochaeta isovalerica]MBB6481432.1 hypothetical protein [Spirochaeta isovalerica]